MSRCIFIATLMALGGCTGLAWDTHVANEPHTRAAIVASVIPGVTTETQFMTRWGRPTQIIREGAQEAWIYRDMTNPPGNRFPQFGTSTDYVIVDFQYGIAIGARSSDVVGCRGTFAPRPPGHGFDNPSTVHPVNCVSPAGISPPLPVVPGHPIPASDHPIAPIYPDPVTGEYPYLK